jgi:putative transposase
MLAVRNMMANGRLARAIADVGFHEINRQLKYKAGQVVEADRFYPSSKTCSSCGSIKQTLKLSDRVFKCEHCGHECDRDENAARNLEKMAANRAVSVRGAGSPARRRKLSLSSLASKREAGRSGAMKPNDEGSTT